MRKDRSRAWRFWLFWDELVINFSKNFSQILDEYWMLDKSTRLCLIRMYNWHEHVHLKWPLRRTDGAVNGKSWLMLRKENSLPIFCCCEIQCCPEFFRQLCCTCLTSLWKPNRLRRSSLLSKKTKEFHQPMNGPIFTDIFCKNYFPKDASHKIPFGEQLNQLFFNPLGDNEDFPVHGPNVVRLARSLIQGNQ